MDLLKPLKSVVNKVKDTIDQAKTDQEQSATLKKWQKKLEVAKADFTLTVMDEREAIYLGTREVDMNVNNGQTPTKKANNIYNIAFEMVEAQVSTQIPEPSVKSKRQGFDDQAKMIEDSIGNDLKETGIEGINDIVERITPIQGYSIITVDWDPDFKHHLYRGELKLSSKHPKQLIPQPKVWDIQKMDYFFVLSSVTKEYVKRRYNVELSDSDGEQYPEVNTLLSSSYGSNSPANEPVTEIVCWYKDSDGDICKFVWANDTTLEDLPKYFYRRDEKGDILKEETLAQDVTISDGTTLPQGTQVPYFVPTRYPIIVRKNVPKNFSFGGQSDIDVLRDQQDSIKKAGTKLEEKMIKGGSIVVMPEDLNVQVTNETYQVIRANAQQSAAIQVRELTAPIEKDIEYIQHQREIVQYMIGVTNSFQGLQDTTALSGRAKQIQVQQASGRMQSKIFNKYTAFKELFEIMFEFKLAFYDELRPYLTKDANGNDQYGEFNKYAFICKDDSGVYYYNTDFIFSADTGSGLPKDPMFIFQQAQDQYKSGAIDKLQYWTIMESLHFPMAKEIKGQIQEQMQQQAQAQQQQAIVPKEAINFKDLPPEGQVQMAKQAGIDLSNPAHPLSQLASQLPPHEQQALANATPDQLQQIMGGMQNG